MHETIRELDLPMSLFTDLISAFKQDVVKPRYANFGEVLDYCRRSANPIGRLVLLLHRVREGKLHQLSDHICTALQLANFWQDVGVDLQKDRIYLPQRRAHSVWRHGRGPLRSFPVTKLTAVCSNSRWIAHKKSSIKASR